MTRPAPLRRHAAAALVPILILWGGCPDGSSTAPEQLVVFAAASLTDAFTELEAGFEAANPDIDVALAFAGSQFLRLQIEQGAPAQVFASANQVHMDTLVQAGLVRESTVFAHNELVVIVPLDDPAGIAVFTDLPRASRVVLGAETVPVGMYTRQLLEHATARLGADFAAAVRAHTVSEETNVRLARAKVELGEADAAIVYRTDATSSDRVRLVPVPAELNVRADYFIGPVAGATHPELGRRWIDHVRSAAGRQVLSRHGFLCTP